MLEDAAYHSLLETHLDTSYCVEALSISSDIAIEEDELRYLVGIREGTIVSLDDIKRGCMNLQKKQKFQSMSLHVTQGTCGTIFTIDLQGAWTFGKIYIQGPLLGKEGFKQYYLLESGELFDIKKHYDSCKKIERVLKNQGYFNGSVTEYLSYNRTTKIVDATFIIERNNRFMIEAVQVRSKSTVPTDDTKTILSKIQELCQAQLEGKYFSKDLVDAKVTSIKKHLVKKGFSTSSLFLQKHLNRQQNRVILTLYIAFEEKREFVFFGNHYFSKDQLLDNILAFGRSAWLLPPELLAQELEQLYREKGFWQIKIECQHEVGKVFFIISEGPRAFIHEVEVQGVTQAHSKQLKKIAHTCIKKQFYDGARIERFQNQMRAWYEQQGFCALRILKYEFVPLEKQSAYTLVFTLEEGIQYRLTDVIIDGFPELRDCGPFATLKPHARVIFDIRLLYAQRDWLIEYLRTHGYLYAKVNYELQFDGPYVTVIWHVLGCENQVTFGKTIVRGLAPFPFKYVFQELGYQEHAIWNSDLLEKSLLNFRDLGIFETVHIFPDTLTDRAQEKSVILTFVEESPCELRLRAGFQQVSRNFAFKSGSTYKFGGSFAWKNPCKVADQCMVNADVTKYYHDVVFAYRRPWIESLNMNILMKGYFHKYIQPVFLGSDQPLYTEYVHGILCRFGKHISHIDIGCTFGCEAMETKGLSIDLAQAIDFSPALIDKKVPYVFFESAFFINFLDNAVNPISGFFFAFSCKGMFACNNENCTFVKMLFEHGHFFPLQSIVCGIRFRAGHIFKQKFPHIMPAERFYLGGDSSIRSIEKDMAPPLGIFIDQKGEAILVPHGGRSMVNANIEFRIPLFRDFDLALFQDIGTLIQNSFAEVRGSRLLLGTGFGFRYQTPVGPIRFDIGWRWRRQEEREPKYAWFLTFGQAY